MNTGWAKTTYEDSFEKYDERCCSLPAKIFRSQSAWKGFLKFETCNSVKFISLKGERNVAIQESMEFSNSLLCFLHTTSFTKRISALYESKISPFLQAKCSSTASFRSIPAEDCGLHMRFYWARWDRVCCSTTELQEIGLHHKLQNEWMTSLQADLQDSYHSLLTWEVTNGY